LFQTQPYNNLGGAVHNVGSPFPGRLAVAGSWAAGGGAACAKRNGFTLIELLITVAVVALLATVALPSYTGYVARGKIVEGISALADYRVKMEQYFQDNRNYGTAGGSCPVAAPASSNFTFSCLVGAATPSAAYAATATSIAGALGGATGDYTYSISETNAKTTPRFKGAPVAKGCWLIRGSEC
jgi:type IV pilus assembly protein PilE